MSEPQIPSPALEATALSPMPSVVLQLGPTVLPGDVDGWVKYNETTERIARLKTLIDAWKDQQGEERRLRKTYARAFLFVLSTELIAVFVAFFLIGAQLLAVQDWLANTFLLGALAQTSSLVLLVVKYLFPERGSEVLRLIEATAQEKTPTTSRNNDGA